MENEVNYSNSLIVNPITGKLIDLLNLCTKNSEQGKKSWHYDGFRGIAVAKLKKGENMSTLISSANT